MPDQVRTCQERALKEGIDVQPQHIFTDADVSGAKLSRPGLDALLAELSGDAIDVVLTVSISRLYRNLRGTLAFIDQHVVGRRKRCIFINDEIDTDEPGDWRMMMTMQGMLGEMMLKSTKGQIRAGQIGLLLQNHIHGTIPFGYRGVEVAGQPTRKNKARRDPEVDPVAADWVRRIFKLYADQGMSFHSIARLLRDEQAPPPAKAKRWSWRCVKRVIRNLRYFGDWSYGRTENRWQPAGDYSRQFEREAGPLHEHHNDELRIVDDALFDRANLKLDRDPRGRRGRRRTNKAGQDMVDPIRKLLDCPNHGNSAFRTGGSNGEQSYCHACREDDGTPVLYSMINRNVARRVIAEALIEVLRADPLQAVKVVAAAREQLEAFDSPDLTNVDQQRAELKKLEMRLTMVSDTLCGEEDRPKLEKAKADRDAAAVRLRELESELATPPQVPTLAEVQAAFADAEVLLQGVDGAAEDPEVARKLYHFLHTVTGGKISLEQAGSRSRKRGYLRARITVYLVSAARGEIPSSLEEPMCCIEVDLRQPCASELAADEVKAAFDRLGTAKAVAKELAQSGCYVHHALRYWHEVRGLTMPPLPKGAPKSRIKVDAQWVLQTPEIWQRYERAMPLGQIAREVGFCRATVEKVIHAEARRRGVEVMDGRTRRKLSRQAGYTTSRRRSA